MNALHTYKVLTQLKPHDIVGISQEQIDDHWKLYEGYVKQVNMLNEELFYIRDDGEGNSLLYTDRRRRYGFEFNGMVLHEYYFGNLQKGLNDLHDCKLKKQIVKTFGTYNNWKKDFEAAAKSRSIGWTILYGDNATGAITNHFIAENGNGNIAGFTPLLVLDIWEHAYMIDRKAGGRSDYIAAFMQNIHWDKVEERYEAMHSGTVIPK